MGGWWLKVEPMEKRQDEAVFFSRVLLVSFVFSCLPSWLLNLNGYDVNNVILLRWMSSCSIPYLAHQSFIALSTHSRGLIGTISATIAYEHVGAYASLMKVYWDRLFTIKGCCKTNDNNLIWGCRGK